MRAACQCSEVGARLWQAVQSAMDKANALHAETHGILSRIDEIERMLTRVARDAAIIKQPTSMAAHSTATQLDKSVRTLADVESKIESLQYVPHPPPAVALAIQLDAASSEGVRRSKVAGASSQAPGVVVLTFDRLTRHRRRDLERQKQEEREGKVRLLNVPNPARPHSRAVQRPVHAAV